ncbi:hypothetical protein [Longispora albida]|uniref:hypothetical protein n=1 Tax=Longispora albida TaxID=203523 RepID=UPI0003642CA0|nr:hypothetical protein [Longispora albida]
MLHLTSAQRTNLGTHIAEFVSAYPPSNVGAVIFADEEGGFGYGASVPAGCRLIATRGELDVLMIVLEFSPAGLKTDPEQLSDFLNVLCGPEPS